MLQLAFTALLIPSGESEKGAILSLDKVQEMGPEDPRGARTIRDGAGIRRTLMRIAHEILERSEDPDRIYLVAIPNGGVPLARLIAENLEQIADLKVAVGILDTTLYRDDLTSTSERPMLRRTEMPSAVDDRVVILVDDVVKTGRTIRAAMDALMDFGRPRAVQVVGVALAAGRTPRTPRTPPTPPMTPTPTPTRSRRLSPTKRLRRSLPSSTLRTTRGR